jgi:hypothetical protein
MAKRTRGRVRRAKQPQRRRRPPPKRRRVVRRRRLPFPGPLYYAQPPEYLRRLWDASYRQYQPWDLSATSTSQAMPTFARPLINPIPATHPTAIPNTATPKSNTATPPTHQSAKSKAVTPPATPIAVIPPTTHHPAPVHPVDNTPAVLSPHIMPAKSTTPISVMQYHISWRVFDKENLKNWTTTTTQDLYRQQCLSDHEACVRNIANNIATANCDLMAFQGLDANGVRILREMLTNEHRKDDNEYEWITGTDDVETWRGKSHPESLTLAFRNSRLEQLHAGSVINGTDSQQELDGIQILMRVPLKDKTTGVKFIFASAQFKGKTLDQKLKSLASVLEEKPKLPYICCGDLKSSTNNKTTIKNFRLSKRVNACCFPHFGVSNDHIITNKESEIGDVKVGGSDAGSEHIPVMASVELKAPSG